MEDMKDFDLDLNNTDNEDNGNSGIQPKSTSSSVPCTIVYSIIGVSNASTALTGDPGYTESKCN